MSRECKKGTGQGPQMISAREQDKGTLVKEEKEYPPS